MTWWEGTWPARSSASTPTRSKKTCCTCRGFCVDELQRLLKDKEAYNAFFNSLDQVKTQNNDKNGVPKRLGMAMLEAANIFTDENWFWIGAAGLLGFHYLLQCALHSFPHVSESSGQTTSCYI